MQTTIVSAQWLKEQKSSAVKILDATYFLPVMGRDGRAEFLQAHIPDAQFFDIDGIRDETSSLPHMIPSAEYFQSAMRALGLCNTDQIVVYDNSPFLSAARAWWMLRLFGHEAVAVLNGGLAAWQATGGTLTDRLESPRKGNFTARNAVGADVILFEELRRNVRDGTAGQIIDARAAERFYGRAPEPRAGLRSGHIPGSLNLPIAEILNSQTGELKGSEELTALFHDAGFDMDAPAVTSCGSGVTAAGLTLALAVLGKTDIRLYDGSWSEWGASDAPLETE